ncbi:hypothetical protein BKA56DRAFT_326976 [Ilyonectria sp. MPI-CAGE-AT-0026]|nr:hypothetical protein BKA56DRAFT_326976 [Ilyonectria sp. MPI-CAGE-AT-0026]
MMSSIHLDPLAPLFLQQQRTPYSRAHLSTCALPNTATCCMAHQPRRGERPVSAACGHRCVLNGTKPVGRVFGDYTTVSSLHRLFPERSARRCVVEAQPRMEHTPAHPLSGTPQVAHVVLALGPYSSCRCARLAPPG